MKPPSSFEHLVEDWLASAAPVAIPAELQGAVVEAAERTPQRRPILDSWSRPRLLRSARMTVDLAAVIVLCAAALSLLPRTGSGLPGASGVSATPVASAPSRVSPTPEVKPLGADYTIGRHALSVDGIRFSFEIRAGDWEPYNGFMISKNVAGSQGAEGIIFWAGYPDGLAADPCAPLSHPIGTTPELVTEAVATAPGTALISAPATVDLDRLAASHVAVAVVEDLGCDPGYFYNWKAATGGALWDNTSVGDKIRAWVVDVDGSLLFIGTVTKPGAGSGLEQQIEQIVRSLDFE
jgi:hypothetical protein